MSRLAHGRLYAAFVAAVFFAVPASAEPFEAKVIGVIDGDTLDVLQIAGERKKPLRVRLVGIDAPEKAQAFGAVAREQLSRLAYGRMGSLSCRSEAERYGRSLCLVRVDGVDVGQRMIELGLAWHFKRYANTQPREEAASYAASESLARAAKLGLWRDLGTVAMPVPPWEWRRATAADSAHL